MKTTLEQQLNAYQHRRFIALPLAGAIIWSIIALSGYFLSDVITVWVIFIGTGSIVYLAMFISKFTGEDLLDKTRKTWFDYLFLHMMLSALLIFGISIPFFLIDYTSLPLSVGILLGIAWLPFSFLIVHWIGYFHAFARTGLIVLAWYLFPHQRFIIIPLIIVFLYIFSILILERRWQKLTLDKTMINQN